MTPPSILIVGHSCHDTLFLANGSRSDTLGGSASYISNILSALGVPFEVISKVGSDFLYSARLAFEPKVVPGFQTTQFIADFTHGERIERVGDVCEGIAPEDIPLSRHYEIAMAVGIVGEISAPTLDAMARCSRNLVCDIQGLIRVIDPQGHVQYADLEKTPFYSLLDKISYLKASRHEADSIDLEEVSKRTCVLVTEGKGGCTVYNRDQQFKVPSFPVEEVDPTGAGDCFLAGFSVGLLRGLSLKEAVQMGNRFGALAVVQVGVPSIDRITQLVRKTP